MHSPQLAALWTTAFKSLNALWIHDENPLRPHALLTSGNHSNGFFNGDKITQSSLTSLNACSDLAALFVKETHEHPDNVDWVIGPAMGAIPLAILTATSLSRFPSKEIRWGYTQKEEQGGIKSMSIPQRVNISEGDRILLVEDVITTGGSILLAKRAVEERGATPLPYILALVNRSGKDILEDTHIISLINHQMPIWKPEECPLCKQGSEAIRPKGDGWARLNANY